MPIYEFMCTKCDEIHEDIVSDTKIDILICERCGGYSRRIVSTFGFRLLGGRWAKDGYSNEKEKTDE